MHTRWGINLKPLKSENSQRVWQDATVRQKVCDSCRSEQAKVKISISEISDRSPDWKGHSRQRQTALQSCHCHLTLFTAPLKTNESRRLDQLHNNTTVRSLQATLIKMQRLSFMNWSGVEDQSLLVGIMEGSYKSSEGKYGLQWYSSTSSHCPSLCINRQKTPNE